MRDFFKELFEYSHYYNQKLAEIYVANPAIISEKAIGLFNHILNAHQIWNNRISPTLPAFGVWQIHDIKDLKDIDRANFEYSLQILEAVDFNQKISYFSSKGEPFTKDVKTILFHVVNHSTYHRGQIATEFKQNGMKPLPSDYVLDKR